jgi:hypothetical protein
VQFLRDSAPFGLLRQQDAAAARRPLALQPVEHGVEGADEVGDLAQAVRGQPLAGAQQVDRGHQAGEPVDRGQSEPQEGRVGDQHDQQAAHQDHRLGQQDRHGDGHRSPQQQRGGRAQHHRVQPEDPPEQGHRESRLSS